MEDRVSTQNGPKGRRRQTRYNLPLCEEKQWGKQNRGITTQGSTLTQIVTTGSVWARRGNKQWSLAKEHLRVPIKKAGIVGTVNSLPTDIHPAYKSQKRSKSGGKDEAWPWGPMLPPLYEKQPNPRQGADCNREHMWLFARQLAWEAPENPEIKFHKEKKKSHFNEIYGLFEAKIIPLLMKAATSFVLSFISTHSSNRYLQSVTAALHY